MLTPELTGYTNLRLMELVASFFHHYADVVARLGMHALKLHDIEPAQDYTLFCSDVYIIRLNVKPGLQAQNASGRSAFVLDDARVVTLETYSVLSSRIAEECKEGDPVGSCPTNMHRFMLVPPKWANTAPTLWWSKLAT